MTGPGKINQTLALGFDDIERALAGAARRHNEGYPPFNIEREVSNNGEGERFRIIIAVAGFKKKFLEVRQEGRELIIRGEKASPDEGEFLHQGIAMRQFERTFILADGVNILGARLHDGLLIIDLNKPEPAVVSRTIEIKG